ncbi:AP-1-like transcription factor [Elsinoe australis]|uniref:AP-1-like transcription factor n=1 Tax=Elsinoe australis TaxID=40998 RepID=A0A2P8AIJ9_9PEZI|nr:AP-1-like transcription factor [Elsinoe australis]
MADSGPSAATTADADTHHGDELMTEAPKSEGIQADTPSSLGSSPEPAPAADSSAGAPDQQQPPKRKGGRKPIYATSEERKQRNRQAQAAFRERRTEYIKQLEATIKQHEEALRSLQQSHRSAADECLMLRYKNSLLERILLEKGIDVQAELQVKTGSPIFDPSHLPPQMPAPMIPTPLQRTAVNRQQARRSYQARPQPATQYMPRTASMSMHSPTGQPTPSSHASSPTAMSSRSTASIQQGSMPSPASAVLTQGQIQSPPGHPQSAGARHAHRPLSSSHYPSSSGMSSTSNGSSRSMATGRQGHPHLPQGYAYSTQFQKHIDELGKSPPFFLTELYVDIIHEPHPRQQLHQDFEGDDFELPEQFQDFQPHPVQQQLPPTQPPPQGHGRTRPAPAQTNSYPPGHSNLDSFDPMLDSDPFGLTASMHFPTNYSFDQPPEK